MDAAIEPATQARKAVGRQGELALRGAERGAHPEPLPERVRGLRHRARTLAHDHARQRAFRFGPRAAAELRPAATRFGYGAVMTCSIRFHLDEVRIQEP
jgi:hypothetical protein